MKKNQKILISLGSLLLIVFIILISTFIYLKKNYLFMPYEYKESPVFWLKWNELKKPMQIEYCRDDDRWNCVISRDEDELKYFIESFKDVTFTTRSRGEMTRIEFPKNWGKRYFINIRIIDEIDEQGHASGVNIFSIDVYENFIYIRWPGTVYYYFEIPNHLREHIFNKEYK